MGDYNDEPFDASMDGHLLASRDRRLVQNDNDHLLYNPFWRLLGERDPHMSHALSPRFPGTCYYDKGDTTHWRTFDQIMVSAACLMGKPWNLIEEFSQIIDIQPLNLLLPNKKSIFDHFPVMSIIERELDGTEAGHE
jgi:hypothetical protein